MYLVLQILHAKGVFYVVYLQNLHIFPIKIDLKHVKSRLKVKILFVAPKIPPSRLDSTALLFLCYGRSRGSKGRIKVLVNRASLYLYESYYPLLF